MSPFSVVAVLLLTLLFVLLGTINLVFGGPDADSFEKAAQAKTKTAS
jgi:hypothetical protein